MAKFVEFVGRQILCLLIVFTYRCNVFGHFQRQHFDFSTLPNLCFCLSFLTVLNWLVLLLLLLLLSVFAAVFHLIISSSHLMNSVHSATIEQFPNTLTLKAKKAVFLSKRHITVNMLQFFTQFFNFSIFQFSIFPSTIFRLPPFFLFN